MRTFFKIASATVLTTTLVFAAQFPTAALATASHDEAKGQSDGTTTASIAAPAPGDSQSQRTDLGDGVPSISALVLEALGEAPEIDDDGDLSEQSLRAFYAGSAAQPIWISSGQPNAKAKIVVQEIARSDLFGMDPSDYDMPDTEEVGSSIESQAKFELAMTQAVLKFAHDAKAGRIHPSKARHSLNNPEGLKDTRAFLEALQKSDDVKTVLEGLHPQHPQFKALQKKLVELMGGTEEMPRRRIPDGPVLKRGERHAHVALLRKRLGVEGADGPDAEKFDDTVLDAVKAFQKSKGLKQDGIVGNGTRHALNGESNEQLKVRIITNMERWRWLPDDLDGDAGMFVWTNIPEFRVRIVKGEEVVFKERVIVGKTDKQTPVFSDEMEWIEIHPTWYVPMSIIVEDIGPSLKRPTSTVMERYHLRLNCGAHGSDWKKIDWDRVSIRNCSVSQPPGAKSVLGDFKFKFPNRHDVYMHDTPQRRLFNSTVRTYSHGCMRIRNPRRMAEILLGHDKGMSSERIGQILKGPKRLHKEDLNKHVPVHVTYFTVFFDEQGEMRSYGDVYGHDRRLAELLTGKGELLPRPAIAAPRKRKPSRTRTAGSNRWDQNAFINN